MIKVIYGADYAPTWARVVRTRGEWQEIIADVTKNGGRRRVEHGETFLHDSKGKMIHEIYANVPEPRS